VSSCAHEDIKGFDFDDPQALTGAGGRRPYPKSEFASLLYTLAVPWAHPAFVQYAHTKHANLLFTYELARRLGGTGVTVNALHPGFVASSFSAGNGAFGWIVRQWMNLWGISPEEGAKTSVYLATSPEVDGISGQYFVHEKPVLSSSTSRDPAAAIRLWQASEKLTGTHLS
jgi:NAD(P)-dependent dehydrogenase (short-subunit alcohol dehydrogenase family)